MFPPIPRPSNAITDLMLSLMCLTFNVRIYQTAPPLPGTIKLRRRACVYLSILSVWQMIGAWGHIFNPSPAEMDFIWYLYILLGAASPCLYGSAVAMDIEAPSVAAQRERCFLIVVLAFAILSAAQIDLANYLPLPREQELTLSPGIMALLPSWIPWLPNVISSHSGEGPPVLRFDGRGYASIPFELSFDARLKDSFDLVAPFPCWKTHSLAFLFLVFGLGINFILLVWTFRAYHRTTGQQKHRVLQWVMAHCATAVGVFTMPIAMFFSGVSGGIDWMHLINGIGIVLQCRGLVAACDAPAKATHTNSCQDQSLKVVPGSNSVKRRIHGQVSDSMMGA